MVDFPVTRLSLLVRLRDGLESEAWDDFVRIYGPIVYGFARRKGLQDCDAADVTQEVLHSVISAIEKFTSSRPERFRSWLFTLAHRRLYDFGIRRRRETPGSGDTGVLMQLHEQPAPHEEDLWEREWQMRTFAWAAEKVRAQVAESTWLAFWWTAVEGMSGKEAAARLKMTVANVFMAKSRVMFKLKEEVAAATDEI
jgi:RNA polymerase sigma factor (sigma-70 family)